MSWKSQKRSERNQRLRDEHIPVIKTFCDDLGVPYKYMNSEYQIRIGGVMDVFPTSNKYHLIKTNERGQFTDYEELGRIFTEYIAQLDKEAL